MNIFKKIFPKYESKLDMKNRLEKQVEYYKGAHYPKIFSIERNIQCLKSFIEFDEMRPIPTDILKRKLSNKMIESLESHIDYDIEDIEGSENKRLIGTLYIAIKK